MHNSFSLLHVAGAQSGLWQVTIVSGLGAALSIYLTAYFSDAHINPAVTLAFAIVRFRSFPWWKIFPYMVAQLLGGILAGALLLGTYGAAIANFEVQRNITRGEPGSQLSAMVFGEYFPNPAVFSHDIPSNLSVMTLVGAFFVEAWGTAVLVFIIFAVTDKNNSAVGKDNGLVPLLIGLTVAFLLSLYAPLTQAGLNPARDFGPRLVSAMAGWGVVAIPGPRNGFWLYILAPFLGGPIGGAMHDLVVANIAKFARTEYQPSQEQKQEEEQEETANKPEELPAETADSPV